MLASWLRLGGFDVVTTREPGGTPLGKLLRQALLDAQAEVDPLAELLLYAADRAQHVRTLLRPALETSHIVLSDRYADATVAYQGAGRGFTRELIASVVELATGGLKPDLTLVFDVSVAQCLMRTKRRETSEYSKDRLDAEDIEFYARVRDAYLEIAAAEPERVRVLDASGSIEETHAEVIAIIMPFLEERGLKGHALERDSPQSAPQPPPSSSIS
jgi:dTMP kinase